MDLDQVPYYQVLLGSCLDLDLGPFQAFQVLQEACFDFQEASSSPCWAYLLAQETWEGVQEVQLMDLLVYLTLTFSPEVHQGQHWTLEAGQAVVSVNLEAC